MKKSSLVEVPEGERRTCETEGTRSYVGEVQINGLLSIAILTYGARYPSGFSDHRVLIDGTEKIDMSKSQARALIELLKVAIHEG